MISIEMRGMLHDYINVISVAKRYGLMADMTRTLGKNKIRILSGENMIRYYKSGFETGVIRFAEYLKENSCFYDIDNYHSFRAIDIDDIDDLLEKFFDECEYI